MVNKVREGFSNPSHGNFPFKEYFSPAPGAFPDQKKTTNLYFRVFKRVKNGLKIIH